MQWFRLWHEARSDAKLQSLADDEHRVWFNLLCFANEQPERGVIAVRSERLLAVEVARGDVALLQRTLEALVELHIIERIERDGEALRFMAWEKRQRSSDNVAERVGNWREKKRNEDVTLQKRYANVGVTPPEGEGEADADSETDTEVTSKDTAEAAGESGGSSSSGDPHSLAVLCAQVTQAAHLNGHEPQALARSLARYRARASPDDLLAEAGKAAEWVREKPRRKMSVRFLDNWFKRAFDEHETSNHHGSIQGSAASNGHRAASQPQTLAGFAGAGVEAPDPTERGDGIYAGWVKHGRPPSDAG